MKIHTVCIDFDGTIVKHEYPFIGEVIPGAIEAMKDFNKRGIKIILYTMRSGKTLKDAVKFLEDNGIALYSVNDNPSQKHWTKSNKVYASTYIDDAAYGCPLIHPDDGSRPFVDWSKINI